MSTLVSVIPNSTDEHIYVHLSNKEGVTVINLTVYARKSLSEWRQTKKPILLTVGQINKLALGLNKARLVGAERGDWHE